MPGKLQSIAEKSWAPHHVAHAMPLPHGVKSSNDPFRLSRRIGEWLSSLQRHGDLLIVRFSVWWKETNLAYFAGLVLLHSIYRKRVHIGLVKFKRDGVLLVPPHHSIYQSRPSLYE